MFQLTCVSLGVAFFWSAFALSTEVLFGGLVIGSLMFASAALLGADHTASQGATGYRRRFFKLLALGATIPVLACGAVGVVQSAAKGRWVEAMVSVLELGVLAVALAALCSQRVAMLLWRLLSLGHEVRRDAFNVEPDVAPLAGRHDEASRPEREHLDPFQVV